MLHSYRNPGEIVTLYPPEGDFSCVRQESTTTNDAILKIVIVFIGVALYTNWDDSLPHSSSVRPYGLPPSPREKVFGVRGVSNYNLSNRKMYVACGQMALNCVK